ncbi:MAG: cytochrome c, partial [Betaproteobacteria bacterium]
ACAVAVAQAPSAADINAGRTLSDRDCVACHHQKFSPPEAIYLRPDRKVHTLAALRAQVARCNVELATQYFPEEEEHIVAYLNATWYHLPP